MRFRFQSLALVLVLVALIGSTACAAFFKTKGGQPVPSQTQTDQLKAVDQARRVGDAVVGAVTSAYRGEITLYGLRRPDGSRFISPSQHRAAADIVTDFGTATKQAVADLKDAASTPQTARSAVQLILDKAREAFNKLGAISPEVKGYVDTAVGLIEVLVVPRL